MMYIIFISNIAAFYAYIIYEDLNSHLLTLTQLAEESTALTNSFKKWIRIE